MKFFALIFAILAFVPRALQWLVAFLAEKMGGCTLPAKTCMINDIDQSELLNKLYEPNWFSTTGTTIGIIGFVIFFGAMVVMDLIDKYKTQKMLDKGTRHVSGGGVVDRDGTHYQSRNEKDYGRMPRPRGFDKYGRPRE